MLTEAVAKVDRLRQTIFSEAGRWPQFVDIGGGLPAMYSDQQMAVSPSDYVEALRKAAPDLMTSRLKLITEFGRAIQAGCGIAMSRVEY